MVERLFNTSQVAELLDMSTEAVMKWIEKGWLPFKRLPEGPIRVSETQLVEFLKGRGIDIGEIMSKVEAKDVTESPAEPQTPDAPQELGTYQPVARPANPPAAQDEVTAADPPVAQDEVTAADPAPQSEAAGADVNPDEAASADINPDEAASADINPDELAVRPNIVSLEITPVTPAGAAESAPADEPDNPVEVASQVAEAVLSDAIVKQASCIHLNSTSAGLELSLRIDGVLQDKPNFKRRLPASAGPELIAYLKGLADLEGDVSAGPQSGRFTTTVEGGERTFRLVTCPTADGEKLVLHVVDPPQSRLSLGDLGLAGKQLTAVRGLLGEPGGLIVTVDRPRREAAAMFGAMLSGFIESGRNCAAVGAGRGQRIDGVLNYCTDGADGMSAADILRAVRDQDVDVVMIEGITEPAVLQMAVDIALDGPVVLVGLLARDPSVALEDLLKAADPLKLAATLLGVITRRSVRRTCTHCRGEDDPSAELLERLCLSESETGFTMYTGQGCQRCEQSGCSGTTGVLSLLEVDAELAKSLRAGAEPSKLARSMAAMLLSSQRRDILAKLRSGDISPAELARVFAPVI